MAGPTPVAPQAAKTVPSVLTVTVTDTNNKPVPGAEVEVVGQELQKTNAKGVAVLATLKSGTGDFKVRKKGFGPEPDSGKKLVCGEVRKTIEIKPGPNTESVKLAEATFTKITATMPGVHGIRDKSKKFPDDKLKESSSDKTTLNENPPVILIRGSAKVVLSTDSNAKNPPVDWKVDLVENSGAKPDITPKEAEGTAELSTDKAGTFSVIATLGTKKVVWNVCFCFVEVLVGTSNIVARSDLYEDAKSGTKVTNFKSGVFDAKDRMAWHASVKVRIHGGGTSGDTGKPSVRLRVLQNAIADSLQGHYENGTTVLELPLAAATGERVPIVDNNGPDGDNAPSSFATPHNEAGNSPFFWKNFAFQQSTDPGDATLQIVETGDSPTGFFRREADGDSGKLRSISGVNEFRIAVCSFSTDAPHMIVAHAHLGWKADYAGKVEYEGVFGGGVGRYVPNGAKTTSDPAYKLLGLSSGGVDVVRALLETQEPRFNENPDKKIFKP